MLFPLFCWEKKCFDFFRNLGRYLKRKSFQDKNHMGMNDRLLLLSKIRIEIHNPNALKLRANMPIRISEDSSFVFSRLTYISRISE